MKFDNINDIQAIINLMNEHGLTEFEMEENGVRISIKKGTSLSVVQAVPASPLNQENATKAAEPGSESSVAETGWEEISAPFVGTFYRSSAPDADSYVTVGQEVGPDTILCIIEAMKVMNEIKAEISGVIKEILVENAQAVQYGQPLFRIEKR